MCRLYGFRSAIRSSVHQSLLHAENALARQSSRHSDGWGLSYYVAQYPHLIRNDQQALGDELFRELSAVVATRTFLAHIRLATAGSVRVPNCHPFQYGRWSFAHNGEVGGYARPEVHTVLLEAVDKRFRPHILGETDSEVLFHIFLSRLARIVDDVHSEGVRADQAREALRETVEIVLDGAPDDDARGDNKLNFVLTNGTLMLGFRWRRELYVSTYKTRCPERSSCFAYDPARCEAKVDDGEVKHLIIASEPLSDGPNVWEELSDGEYVCVGHGMNFQRGRLLEL